MELGEGSFGRLQRLVGLWRQYGRAINLVGGIDEPSLWEHVTESLLGVALVEQQPRAGESTVWVDVGSGGGLPGLVVAAVREWETVLIEPRERRAAFLDLGLASVGMGRGYVIRGRWDDSTWNKVTVRTLEPRTKTPFVILSSRAVFSPEKWLSEAGLARLTRGITLCHVESSASEVAGKKPSGVVRDGRWAVMGFPVETHVDGDDLR